MANITRFGPIEDAFDELFRGFFVRPVSFEGPGTAAASAACASASPTASPRASP